MPAITVGDIDINYETAGSGPPVILLHGLAEDHRSWSEIQAGLNEWSTYAIDVRGHGATTIGKPKGSLNQLGDDLIGFIEKVTGPAAVVGFSLSGTIVLWAAVKRPDLITHPILVATSSVIGKAGIQYYHTRIAQLESGDYGEFAAGLREDTSHQVLADVDVSSLLAYRLETIGRGEGFINAAQAMAGLRELSLNDFIHQIHHHVDIIGADGDQFCPRKAADIMMESLPDATYHEIAGSRHLIRVDQPDALINVLKKILGGDE